MASRLTLDVVDALDVERVVYMEETLPGAMGNAGGIVLEVLEGKELVRYETNIAFDEVVRNAAAAKIKDIRQHYDSHYGGFGNDVYFRKGVHISIDEQNGGFIFRHEGREYLFRSSVTGVFKRVVASLRQAAQSDKPTVESANRENRVEPQAQSQQKSPENEVQIRRSSKAGLESKESFIVTRGNTGFLRILGEKPSWELMTATASEDRGGISVCPDQLRLVESALRLCSELKTSPAVHTDWMAREYVKICGLIQREDMSDEQFNRELRSVLERFFQIYDACTDLRTRAGNEMIQLYRTLSVDETGGDVYLSDGVWLRSDGSLHDLGR